MGAGTPPSLVKCPTWYPSQAITLHSSTPIRKLSPQTCPLSFYKLQIRVISNLSTKEYHRERILGTWSEEPLSSYWL